MVPSTKGSIQWGVGNKHIGDGCSDEREKGKEKLHDGAQAVVVSGEREGRRVESLMGVYVDKPLSKMKVKLCYWSLLKGSGEIRRASQCQGEEVLGKGTMKEHRRNKPKEKFALLRTPDN